MPIINVGGPDFDEYGDTKYSLEDCFRLRKAVDYHLEGLRLSNKVKIRYETMYKGMESLNKQLIIDTLCYLREAAELAIKERSGIIFYGD